MSPESQGHKITPELIYGLSLHTRRCQSIIGAQVFRTMFYLFKIGFKMDDEIADAMVDHEDKIEFIQELYYSWYRQQKNRG
jgi:hypothetical protein